MAIEQVTEKVSGPQRESLSSICGQLDMLWALYLDLLDDYTTAQTAIKEHMSSGYFALAQANFKSSRGGRYGQDYYDERAAATMRAVLDSRDEGVSTRVQKHVMLEEAQSTQDGESSEDLKKGLSNNERDKRFTGTFQPTQIPTPAATPEPESEQESIDHDGTDTQAIDKTGIKKVPSGALPQVESAKYQVDLHDPIRWFGILVPPTLRQAQKSFTMAISDSQSLSKAVNSSRRMREVEVEIRKLRKIIKKVEKTTESRAQSPPRNELPTAV
ncbi:hypothetical protein BST61_g1612 [Cercospora zeina]